MYEILERVEKTTGIEKKTMDIEERGVRLRLTIVDTPGKVVDLVEHSEHVLKCVIRLICTEISSSRFTLFLFMKNFVLILSLYIIIEMYF